MVIASVPLWVVHSSASASTKTPISTAGTDPTSTAGTDPTSTLGVGALAALASIGSGSGSGATIPRAPLYSCDVHPDGQRFATAGGDGAVKIWSLGSVFSGCDGNADAGNDDACRKGGRDGKNGSKDDGGKDDGGKDDNKKKRKMKAMAHYDSRGRFVSSSSSSSSSEESASAEAALSGGGAASDGGHDGGNGGGNGAGATKDGAEASKAAATAASDTAATDTPVVQPTEATPAPAPASAASAAAASASMTAAAASGGVSAAATTAAATAPSASSTAPPVLPPPNSNNKNNGDGRMTVMTAMGNNGNGGDGKSKTTTKKKRKRAVLLSTVPFDAAISGVAVGADDRTGAGADADGRQQQQQKTAMANGGGGQSGSGATGTGMEEGGDGAAGAASTAGTGSNNGTRHRLLCTLSSHSGSVLAVRWSSGGKYLASAGDDSLVLIYAKSNRTQPAMRGNLLSAADQTTPDVEHWSRVRICRGHNLDVVGLAWSPDDLHLVSCSLDSAAPICVWRLNLDTTDKNATSCTGNAVMGSPARSGRSMSGGGFGFGSPSRPGSTSVILTPFKTLSASSASGGDPRMGHTSTVKGVAIDPTGKYLASSGDDPSVCIWRAYDDWGLEAKVDQKDGIFGGKAGKAASGAAGEEDGEGEDVAANDEQQQLASLSLFRRISFSPDGIHVCVTNATVRGKTVATTVSREGWKTACEKPTPVGAANLVGHKAAVVTSRHCPYFIDGKKLRKRPGGGAASSSEEEEESSEDENTEPAYATLLALGDKHGFITVWSTKSKRPIFKAQISETRCTVTDLSWGLMPSASGSYGSDIVLLISLLDGHVAALRFAVPDEVGALLPEAAKQKIFRLKYGINLRELMTSGRMADAGADKPRLIENALQLTMEEDGMSGFGGGPDDASSSSDEDGSDKGENDKAAALRRSIDARAGIGVGNDDGRLSKLEGRLSGDDGEVQPKKKHKQGDSIDNALSEAALAAKTAEGLSRSTGEEKTSRKEDGEEKKDDNVGVTAAASPGLQQRPPQDQHQPRDGRRAGPSSVTSYGPVIPTPNQRVFSVDLPLLKDESSLGDGSYGHDRSTAVTPLVVDCSNVVIANPSSSSGRAQGQVPSVNLSISQSGQVKYRDTILGATATAICATESMLAIGTYDGTIYLYGSSPTTGWKSGLGFRCHAPLVLGCSVVRMHLRETNSGDSGDKVEMLVVTADGDFGLYSLVPTACLLYRGTVLPPMEHMRLSSNDVGPHRHHKAQGKRTFPELSRISVTDSGRLLLLLSYSASSSSVGSAAISSGRQRGGVTGSAASLPGGNLQAFVYNRPMKLWVRVSDSRFTTSDFYDSPLLSAADGASSRRRGPLAKIEAVTRSAQGRSGLSTSSLYRQGTSDVTSMLRATVSRSHCEDRMACALALQSKDEFEHWLGFYVSCLSQEGNETHLRLLVDMLLGKCNDNMDDDDDDDDVLMGDVGGGEEVSAATKNDGSFCWWLSSAESVLGMDRKAAVRKIVLPEMSKNRSNQRLANEIATELSAL